MQEQVYFILGLQRRQVGLEVYGKAMCQEVTEVSRNQVIQALVSHGKGFNFYGKCCWNLYGALKQKALYLKRSLYVGKSVLIFMPGSM